MVRIRKKTSNRMTTAHRAKIKHKARETKKKGKKEAKKNPNAHKKKKKDLGIPNSFPFKEQILAEVVESRRLAIEEKRRKEEQGRSKGPSDNQSSSVATTAAPITVTTGSSSFRAMDVDVPPLIDTSLPNTAAALDAADLVLYILDARDPLSYRSAFIEETVGKKPLIYILNKIDLAPREAASSWAKALRQRHPTFYFRSSSSNLPTEEAQKLLATNPLSSAKAKVRVSDTDALGRDVVLEALHTAASKIGKSELTVSVVGVTNVGKSAFINSMLKANSLTVYNSLLPRDREGTAPCTTPYPQSVTLTHKKSAFTLIDTPGLSFIPPPLSSSMEDTETRIARDILLRNRGNISKIKEPLPAALYILSRAVMEDLLMLYNLPAVLPGDYDAFLSSLARKEGALQKKGAVIDFQAAARAVVRDWKTGRFAHYTHPPPTSDEPVASKSTILDLSSIYQKNDDKLLSQMLTRKELRKQRGALIQLKDAVLDERKVDLEAVQMLDDDDDSDEDEEEDGEEMDEDDENDDEASEDDEEGVDEDEDDSSEDEDSEEVSPEPLPIAAPPLSGKKKREATRTDQGRPTGKSTNSKPDRRVSFAPYTKAGAKVKKVVASKAEPVVAVKSSNVSKGMGKKKAPGEGEGDAYDFAKYF